MGKRKLTVRDETARTGMRSMRTGINRREVLAGLASLAAASWSGCGEEPHLPLAAGPFPLGVASGEATSTGSVLWTRYAGTTAGVAAGDVASSTVAGSTSLEVSVWQGAPLTGTLVHAGPAEVGEGGYVKLAVEGLQPGERYSYSFSERGGGARSQTGRFRTAPAPDALPPMRFGATSCTKYGHAMDSLARAAERSDLDLFLLLGDACYNDGALDMSAFRASWERTLAYSAQQELRAAHALLASWDDHEFTNDITAEKFSPEYMSIAKAAFFEHVPMRRLPEAPGRLWRSLTWGRTAEFFLLDCRTERRPSTRLSADAEYLSRAQMDWLKLRLKESRAVFKVILNSVPISEFPGAFFQSTVDDRWEGFPAQRNELLGYIEQADIPGVLWLAGDFHLASCGRVSRTGPGTRAVEVLVGPGAQEPNPSPTYPSQPQFDWSTGINNYAVLDLDPSTRQVTVRHLDGANRQLAVHTYTL